MGGARTLARWLAFLRGGTRADERASVVALTVARGTLTRKDKRAHRLSDFGLVPASRDGEGGGPRDWRSAKALLRAAFGGA